MFEIPDDDLLWSDDFPLDDFISEVETKAVNNGTSLESLSAKIVALDNVNQELQKQEDTNRLGTKASNYNVAPAEELTNLCKRKFPGPAGVLPPYSPELDKKLRDTPEISFHLGSATVGEPKNEPQQLSWSQEPAGDIFASPQWKSLVSDLGQNAQSLLSKFSIRSSLLKANRKLLNRGKIPLIIGVMDGFEMQGSDASFVLRDPSGKMNGALHRDLFKEPSTALQPGSVLVLRQVSVISPSSRTHYLNITPANVALIYTASREAVVAKRPWTTSQLLTSDNELISKDSEMQLLDQIIEDSEQEMSDYLRNLHQGLETCSSPSPGVGEFLFNTGLSRGHTPSFSPRTPFALQRHRNNFKPDTPVSRKAPLFTSVSSLGHSAQAGTCRAAPTSSSNSLGNFRQPIPTRIVPAANHPASVCNVSARAVRVSSTSDLAHKSDMISTITKNILQGSPAVDRRATFQQKPSFVCKNNGETPSNLNSFRDDFPDNDDEIMLQMYDEALSQTLTEGQSHHSFSGPLGHQREFSRRNESMSPRIISKAFEDCRNENQRIHNIIEDIVAYKTTTPYSYTGNKYISTGNNSIYLKTTTSNTSVTETSPNLAVSSNSSDVTKRFSFKRSHPPSQSPLITKRPMFEVANKITPNSVQSPFNDKPVLSMGNFFLKTDMKNSEHFPMNSDSSLPTINSAVPKTLSEFKQFTSATSIVQPSVVNFSIATPGGAGMFLNRTLHNKSVIIPKEASERYSDIQSTRKGFHSTSTADQLFPHWDDDLTDDLILSQLSDDF